MTNNRSDVLGVLARRERLRELAASVPPVGLSRADATAWLIARAADPYAPEEVLVRRLPATRFRAVRSFYTKKLSDLIRRKQLLGQRLDPDTDPELAAAMSAAWREQMAQLVPGQPLFDECRSIDRATTYTWGDDRRFYQRQAIRVGLTRMADRLADSADEARRHRLTNLRARLRFMERMKALAEEAER